MAADALVRPTPATAFARAREIVRSGEKVDMQILPATSAWGDRRFTAGPAIATSFWRMSRGRSSTGRSSI
jgi:hypothetical protein